MYQAIVDYLTDAYHPHTILLYGSYSRGTQTQRSDFDVLLVTDRGKSTHDDTAIGTVTLDAFIYTTQDFLTKQDPQEFLQVLGGQILLDQQGLARDLLARLERYAAEHAAVPEAEKTRLRNWCVKMMDRAGAGDPEGMLRWHWLLYDSLEIYCNLRDQFYFGPRKTMEAMRTSDPDSYQALEQALYQLDHRALSRWIERVLAV